MQYFKPTTLHAASAVLQPAGLLDDQCIYKHFNRLQKVVLYSVVLTYWSVSDE